MARAIANEPCPRCVKFGNDTRGDNFVVYDDGSKHCFACSHHKFPTYYVPKIKEHPNVPKTLLPFDFTREIPTRALAWLLQYGLPASYWQESTGYSPKEERLVFTVGEPLQFSIGRYVGQESTNKKWFVYGESHTHCEVVGTGPSISLVEDLISAHKIGAAGGCAIPLFGTKIHPCHLYFLINEVRPVILWLDKDQEQNVKKTAMNLESVLARKVNVVVTEKDPKWLGLDVIDGKLKEINYV